MGLFCVNFHVRNTNADDVRGALAKSHFESAIVVPTKNEWTSFYEEMASDQDEARIQEVGMKISKQLGQALVAFMVHDSDIARYWLFDHGSLIDQFNSCPDYFEDSDEETESRGGDPKILLKYCQPKTKLAKLKTILGSEVVFAEEIIQQIAQAMDVPRDHAIRDYRDLTGGNGLDGFDDLDNGDDDDGDDSGGPGNGNDNTMAGVKWPATRPIRGDDMNRFHEMLGVQPSINHAATPTKQFVFAASTGDLQTLTTLLNEGVSPNAEAKYDLPQSQSPVSTMHLAALQATSALMAAVMNNQVTAVQWLLKNGANPNQAHSFFGAPAHAAASSGNAEILRHLIDSGADLHQTSPQGLTPMQTIAQTRAGWSKIMELQMSVGTLGVKLPKTALKIPQFTQLEAGWLACEELIREWEQ
jgi:Ankyrin repeats (3 copies)